MSDAMDQDRRIKKIEVRCLHCGGWFPSPFFATTKKAFEALFASKCSARCPHCRGVTDCNNENMRAEFEGDQGAFRGNATY